LASSRASWAEQRRVLDEENTKLQKSVEDLEKQNLLLHKHMEYVTAEALRAQRSSLPASPYVVRKEKKCVCGCVYFT
jgi:hypothetical protein